MERNAGPSFGSIFGVIFAILSTIVIITILGGSWYTIGQYERGILLRNGAFVKVLQPGLGFKWPWFETVIHVDVRVETTQFKNMEAYSNDQQPAHLLVSVTFEPDQSKLENLYSYYGTRDAAEKIIIEPAVYKYTKIVFGQYTATRAIQERAKLNLDVENAIKTPLENAVFNILSIQVEDVSFGKEYMSAIDARMRAEVEVLRFKQTLEKEKVEADIKRTQAAGTADATKAQADAVSYQTKVIGDAEAGAIRAKGKALSENPRYPEMLQAERWDGKLPHTMLPNGAVPMIQLPKQ